MNKMKIGLTFAIVATVLIAFAVGFHQGQELSATNQTLKLSDIVKITVIRNGGVVYSYTTHNILTTIGARHVRNVYGFANETATQVRYIALSPDTNPNASWTKLPNEYISGGLSRQAGTVTVINSTAFQVQATWTSSTTTTIRCTGLHWSGTAGSDGNLWAVASIPDASVIPNDQIQVTWTVNVPAS